MPMLSASLTIRRLFFYVARYGRTSTVALFLSKGAELNAVDDNDETPLCYAARYNDTKMVTCLLQQKADVSIQGVSKKTPLLYALMYNSANVQTLLRHRANPNIGDGSRTPLFHAAKSDVAHVQN